MRQGRRSNAPFRPAPHNAGQLTTESPVTRWAERPTLTYVQSGSSTHPQDESGNFHPGSTLKLYEYSTRRAGYQIYTVDLYQGTIVYIQAAALSSLELYNSYDLSYDINAKQRGSGIRMIYEYRLYIHVYNVSPKSSDTLYRPSTRYSMIHTNSYPLPLTRLHPAPVTLAS